MFLPGLSVSFLTQWGCGNVTWTRNWPDVILGWQAGSLEADGLVITHCFCSWAAWVPALTFLCWTWASDSTTPLPSFAICLTGRVALASCRSWEHYKCAYRPLGAECGAQEASVLGLLFTSSYLCGWVGEGNSVLLSRFWLCLGVPRAYWLRGWSWMLWLLSCRRNQPGSSMLTAVVNLLVLLFFISRW